MNLEHLQIDNQILEGFRQSVGEQIDSAFKTNGSATQQVELNTQLEFAQNNPDALIVVLCDEEQFSPNAALFCDCENIIFLNNDSSINPVENILDVVSKAITEKSGTYKEMTFFSHGAPSHLQFDDLSTPDIKELVNFDDIINGLKIRDILPSEKLIMYGCNSFSEMPPNYIEAYKNFAVEEEISLIGMTSIGWSSSSASEYSRGDWVEFTPEGNLQRPDAERFTFKFSLQGLMNSFSPNNASPAMKMELGEMPKTPPPLVTPKTGGIGGRPFEM